MNFFNLLEKRAPYFFILTLVVGLFLPQLGVYFKDYIIYALIGVMLATFLKTDCRAVFREFKKPFFLLFIALAYLVACPIVLYFIMNFLTPELSIGFLLYAALPPAIASPVLTNIVKGNPALSLSIMVIANLLVPFTMVGLFWVLIGKNIELDITGMFLTLVCTILVPLFISQILKKHCPKCINKISPSLGGIAILLIMLVLYTVVSDQAGIILENPMAMLKYVAYFYVIFLVLYLIGYFIAPWRKTPDRIALAVTKSYSNAGLGIVLAFNFFSPEVALLLVISQIPWSTTIGLFGRLNKHLK